MNRKMNYNSNTQNTSSFLISLGGITLLVSLLLSLPATCQELKRGLYHTETGESLDAYQKIIYTNLGTLFDNNELFHLTILSDFRQLAHEKGNPKYQNAIYKLIIRDTVQVVNSMRIKARGNFRRDLCSSPPIKLNFKKTKFFTDATDNLKTLKLVNVCRQSNIYQEYIFKEYLTYRLLNILTEKSLRVRLIKIDFEDTSKKEKSSSSYGFIIEDIDELGRRLNALEIKNKLTNQDLTETEHLNLITTFQFMIGNTDWSIPELHNFKLLKSIEVKYPRPYAIPYDFDFSGFVDASYAHPNEILPINEVRERLFRGLCRSPEDMAETFEYFRTKKEEIFTLLNEFSFYSETSRKRSIRYIEEFYEIIDSPKRVKRYFTVNCD